VDDLTFFIETSKEIDWGEMISYLRGLGFTGMVDIRRNIVRSIPESEREKVARAFASARVVNAREPVLDPLPGEIMFERKRFEEAERPAGVLYDAFMLRDIYRMITCGDDELLKSSIVFTDDIIGTKESGYYHSRVTLFSYPSLVSISGFYYALALNKAFYLERLLVPRTYTRLPDRIRLSEKEIREMIKGCVLQALFFYSYGDPFCEKKDCRLYNAHWLEEAFYAQVISQRLCDRHRQMINSLQNPSVSS
jgi:hypothetical protein